MQTEEDILFQRLGESDDLLDLQGEESLLDAPEDSGMKDLQVLHDEEML